MGEEWYSGSNRNDNVDLIDAYVLGFTMNHSKMEIAELYQAKGITCALVNTPVDFLLDPHIQARGFFMPMEHPIIGEYVNLTPPVRLSVTPSSIRRSAPLLGQHNVEGYCEELGCTDEELASLKTEGAI